MEAGMMKVVFSRIINGTSGDLSANEAKHTVLNAAVQTMDSYQPEIRFSQTKAEPDDLKDKSSQEVFASLVNASNCANLQTDKIIDGYLTFTANGSFLREYLS